MQLALQKRGPARSAQAVSLAVILTIQTLGGAVVLLVGLLVAVTLLHRAPTRPCHRCGRRYGSNAASARTAATSSRRSALGGSRY
jgi:hypothetical protein